MNHDLFLYGIGLAIGVLHFLAGVAVIAAPVILAGRAVVWVWHRGRFVILSKLRRRRLARATVAAKRKSEADQAARKARIAEGKATPADVIKAQAYVIAKNLGVSQADFAAGGPIATGNRLS